MSLRQGFLTSLRLLFLRYCVRLRRLLPTLCSQFFGLSAVMGGVKIKAEPSAIGGDLLDNAAGVIFIYRDVGEWDVGGLFNLNLNLNINHSNTA